MSLHDAAAATSVFAALGFIAFTLGAVIAGSRHRLVLSVRLAWAALVASSVELLANIVAGSIRNLVWSVVTVACAGWILSTRRNVLARSRGGYRRP